MQHYTSALIPKLKLDARSNLQGANLWGAQLHGADMEHAQLQGVSLRGANLQGAKLRDRVYGPTFMRRCILASPAPCTHYFLGGSEDSVGRLKAFFVQHNPAIQIVGVHNGYFKPDQENEIVSEINHLSPDFIWVGLGTPRQQEWIHRHKQKIKRGVVFAVGFAFDVNAGTKKDAPLWMQKFGMTWIFRFLSEPLRLGPRYLRYNSLFLFYLLWDGIRGRAFKQ